MYSRDEDMIPRLHGALSYAVGVIESHGLKAGLAREELDRFIAGMERPRLVTKDKLFPDELGTIKDQP